MPDGSVPGRARAADPAGLRRPAASAGLTRRAVLTAAGAAGPMLLAGCRGLQSLGAPPPPPADVRVLRATISAEEVMVARYAAAVRTLGTGPQPAASLAAIRAVQSEHAEHLAQLRSRLVEPSGASSSPSRPPAVQVTGSLNEVLSTLERAEQAASDRLLGELGGLPGSLAQLYASIAASEATHVPFLRSAGQGR